MKTCFLACMIVFMFCKCNKESYIENVGITSTVGNAPTSNKGSVTFWVSNWKLAYCSGGLTIYVDGKYVGDIKEISSVAPICGTNSAKCLTVTLDEGTYDYSATGTGTNCPRYTFKTITVQKGVCSTKELQ